MTALLSTPRFDLRPHAPEDAAFMIALNSDPEVVRYTGDGPLPDEKAALEVIARLMNQWDSERLGRLVVVEKATGERVGWCGLKRVERGEIDLGYRFFRRHWGRGIATETARACVDHAFNDRGFERLIAYAAVDNPASVHVLQKLGFALKSTGDDGEGMVVHNFELLRSAWKKS